MLTKERVEHQIKRAQNSIEKLEMDQENLNEHGYWSLGYWKGRLSVLEDLLDNMNETFDVLVVTKE